MAEMTIDEAIADCVRQVPECATKHTLSARLDKQCDCSDAPTMTLRGMDDAARALWFEAAWEWYAERERESSGRFTPIRSAGGYDVNGVDYPTKYHALAAACKLAKGLKP